MSLSSNVDDLAARLFAEVNALRAEMAALQAASWTRVDARVDANTARPTGWAGVIWIADDTGNPVNAEASDFTIREDLTVT